MSIRLMSEVWQIDLPASDKLVLLALADCANDEGGCWPSMKTLVMKCSKGERTIQASIKSLVEAGHLSRAERLGKGCFYTVHPRRNCTPAETAPPQNLPETPAEFADKPSRTIIVDKPKGLPTARARKISKEVGWSCIPKSWSPPAIEALPQQARACAEKWTAASYAAHGEAFHSFWRSSGKKLVDWDTRWAERVITMHSQIMRDQKYGTAPMDTAPKTITKPMTAAELHRAIDFNRTTGNARRADELAAELARLTGPPNEVHAF